MKAQSDAHTTKIQGKGRWMQVLFAAGGWQTYAGIDVIAVAVKFSGMQPHQVSASEETGFFLHMARGGKAT